MFRRMSTNGLTVPTADQTLPGRETPVPVPDAHYVNGNPLVGPFDESYESLIVGMGCFWGAERFYWEQAGVYTTAPSTPAAPPPTRPMRRPAPG